MNEASVKENRRFLGGGYRTISPPPHVHADSVYEEKAMDS